MCFDQEKDALISRVEGLYQWYSPGSDRESMKKRLCGHPGTEVDLVMQNGSLLAFGVCVPKVLSTTGESCIFRHGVVIDPKAQSQGLYRSLLRRTIERHWPHWVGTRTQNPRIYETWHTRFGDKLYPHPNKVHNETIQGIGVELSTGEPSFDPFTFTVRDVYPEDRTGVPYHECRAPWIADFFAKRLGAHDAMILLARVHF